MLKNGEFWTLVAIGAIALVLALTNMALFAQNQELRAEVASRSQYIQQSAALQNLYRQLVQELGDRAVRTRDAQIRDLLVAQGINVNIDPQQGGTP